MVTETGKIVEQKTGIQADQLEIIYYTDPLCCWSWGMEPQVRRLIYEFRTAISWRYCMGGLLAGWKNYHDEMNSVSRPIQMGPVWMHAQQITGMPMQPNMWMKDPPASSYPACIAVKCAGLQSDKAGERYLRLLREALMLHGKNISREEILLEVSLQLSKEKEYGFDPSRFKKDLENDNGIKAFRKDLEEVQYRQINRFPTFILKTPAQDGLIITGYRPYEIFIKSVLQLAPGLSSTVNRLSTKAYTNFWGDLTAREAAEISNAI